MIRRTLSAVVLAATVASGALLAGPADAASNGGACTLNLPHRIEVNSYFVARSATASDNCTKAEALALWTTTKGIDIDDEDAFDDISGLGFYVRGDEFHQYGKDAIVFVIGDNVRWGRTTFYPAFAGRNCDDDGHCKVTYSQNSPTTDIRLASKSFLTANRKHGVVTLRATSKLYSPVKDRFLGRDVRGLFQTRTRGGEWTTLRDARTTANGHSAMRVKARKGMQYRYVTKAAAHWWGSGSLAHTL